MEIQNLFADRIGGKMFGKSDEIYKFEKIKRAKKAAREKYPQTELLDFGVGEPHNMAPSAIRESLKREIDDPANRGYADNGIIEFKKAAARYLMEFFGVRDIDPSTEINHSIGSKPALAMLPLCFINPGDTALVTVPGYPVLGTHVRYLGGNVINVPLLEQNNFLPDLDALDRKKLDKAKLFYVNYPNNPTGKAADAETFDRLIAFADKHNILIVQDAAYATLVYDREPLSILSRPGGKEAAVELHSMSKSYNMTGWRLGFVAGSATAVKAYAEVKDNIDSGQFKAIQRAACSGIAKKDLADDIRNCYQSRLHKLVSALQNAGCPAEMPGGSFYLYVPCPKSSGNVTFDSAEQAAEFLITELLISTVPWDDAGSYLRFSATFEASDEVDEDRIMTEMETRLKKAELKW